MLNWLLIGVGDIAARRVLPAIQAGTLALAINEGAYMSEIIRAGIESIDPGQMEAAKSLGMNYNQSMWRIILPQAAKVIIPPKATQGIVPIKAATMPLSNAPSSLEATIKIELAAATRPR